jgi:hypothetical protein
MATVSLSLEDTAILLKEFYKKSDDPEDHAGYADFFKDDGTLKLGLNSYHGRKGHTQLKLPR